MQESIPGRMTRIRRCGSGFAAEGPGFFVWDPDRRAVAEAARSLSRGAVPLRTPSRLLFVHGEPAASAADPESLDA